MKEVGTGERHLEKISVRSLVEFILREGNIEPSGKALPDAEAMQQGIKIHKMIQKKRGTSYIPEVPLSVLRTIRYSYKANDEKNGSDQESSACKNEYTIKIEGRADGIEDTIRSDKSYDIDIYGTGRIVIHEIKSMYADVSRFTEAKNIHLAQAKCYAAMYLEISDTADVADITIEITYCQIETMIMKEFQMTYSCREIAEWFENLIGKYSKWVTWKLIHRQKCIESIKGMEFPFEYRKGQFDLVKGVYVSILHKKNLFLQAPTGVGKTISTVYPAVTAMGEGLTDKIFYLTAKTITRTVAEDTFSILENAGLSAGMITLTAKDKICIYDNADCDPGRCPRAKGHYDRINDAVYDIICHENRFTREVIDRYAQKHNVCPFEMSLDIAIWSDVIICDYNYVFDPKVSLRRFFGDNDKKDYVFLVDEAHNLVERARNMYSASINRSLVNAVKKYLKQMIIHVDGRKKETAGELYRFLDRISRIMLEYKRSCDECLVIDSVGNLVYAIMSAVAASEDFIKDDLPGIPGFELKDDLFELYFNMRFFIEIHSLVDDKYRIYADYNENGEFRITLACMDPSVNLKRVLDNIRSTVFFSATLIPVKYYMEQLGARNDDYTIYAETSFCNEQRLILAATDVSARYSRRNPGEYKRISEYIKELVAAKKGNYIVYFPSYKMMDDVMMFLVPETDNSLSVISDGYTDYVIQKKNMTEAEKEDFLAEFDSADSDGERTKIGLCVMGGIFSEGIDLREDRLIGTVIVGTGLPMVGYERELFREYYDEMCGSGFEYAYLYPGMNKVLQAGGRVIRTAADRGVILLLDDRYATRQYNSLFPREWSGYRFVNIHNMKDCLEKFWDNER